MRNLLLRVRVIALVGATLLHATGAFFAATGRAHAMPSLTEADNNRTIELRVGDTVRLSLPENATTGYRWEIDRLNGELIEAVGSESHRVGGAVGSGGEVTFLFRTRKAGADDITLKYWRHFEGDSSIARRFHLRLDTRP